MGSARFSRVIVSARRASSGRRGTGQELREWWQPRTRGDCAQRQRGGAARGGTGRATQAPRTSAAITWPTVTMAAQCAWAAARCARTSWRCS
eukprot:1214744-Pyramimonas_sp.AAC.1